MKKYLKFIVFAFLLSSCSAGGGAISFSDARVQYFWPVSGFDRYESVVYPAEDMSR